MRHKLLGSVFAAIFSAVAPPADALINLVSPDPRVLDLVDTASSTTLGIEADLASQPLDESVYRAASEALRGKGLVDPSGERSTARAAAAKRLQLAPLVPDVRLRLYASGGAPEGQLLEGSSGDVVGNGATLFVSGTGYAAWRSYLGLAYEVQVREASGELDYQTKRLYAKGRWGKWSLQLGRDSARLGPGYHGSLLLDENAPTLDLWRVRTESPLFLPGPLRALGGFRFTLMNAYLSDSNPHAPDERYGSGLEPVEDPRLLGMRMSYHPAPWLDLGVSRTALYGGAGRETYDSFRDWWELFSGLHENVHRGQDDRYDNDQYAALDVSLRLPLLEGLGALRGGRIYWEYAGTDLIANWKSGTGTGSWVPFELDDSGNLAGAYLTTGLTDWRVEYAQTSRAWYRHHQYSQGYSFRGQPLGHHVGGDGRDLFLQVSRYFSPVWRAVVSYDLEERGRSLAATEKRSEFALRVEAYGWKPFGVPLSLCWKGLLADVKDPLDDPRRSDRTELYAGAELTARP